MADEVIVPNPHAESAKALAEKVRALIAEIPRLTPPGPNDAKRLAPAASVSEEFLESARAVMQKSALLEGASRTDAATMRDASAFAMAYEVVLPEARGVDARAGSHHPRGQGVRRRERTGCLRDRAASGEKKRRRRARAACEGHAPQAQPRTSEGDFGTRFRSIRENGAEAVV